MASWGQIEIEVPELAARVAATFAKGVNKTMATVRADGSPRISAIELEVGGGEVTFGMMGDSVKLADVRRDGRVAIHSPSIEWQPSTGEGDAKLAGTAVEVEPPPDRAEEGSGFFRVDVREVVFTTVEGDPPDTLVVESWHEGVGHRRRTRA